MFILVGTVEDGCEFSHILSDFCEHCEDFSCSLTADYFLEEFEILGEEYYLKFIKILLSVSCNIKLSCVRSRHYTSFRNFNNLTRHFGTYKHVWNYKYTCPFESAFRFPAKLSPQNIVFFVFLFICIIQVDPHIRCLQRPEKKILENERNKLFVSFKRSAKRKRTVTWLNPAAQTRPRVDSSFFVPVLMFLRKFATILLLAFSLFEVVAALLQCLCPESNKRMEKSVNTHNRLRYFLTNKIFLLLFMYRYIV